MSFQTLVKNTIAYGILCIILCIISYIYVDRILAISMNMSINGGLIDSIFKLLDDIADPNTWAGIFVIVFLISLWKAFRKKHSQKLYVFTLALFIALAVASVLKFSLARYRPDLYLSEGLYGFHFFSMHSAFNSFPSGHVTLNFAGLLALGYVVNKKSFANVMLIIAIIIAISRILLDKHFLSDILAGMYIGIFSYLWARYLVELYFSKRQTSHSSQPNN